MIIAIDGPAASGKSTVAKKLAQKLNFSHFTTGKMYRAITAYIIKNELILDFPKSILKIINELDISFKNNDFDKLLINNFDYSDYYYTSTTNKYISQISSLAPIRKKMVAIQRFFSKNKNIVCEGRDIGTVVFPDAQIKFYLEASIQCRALRRFNEISTSNSETLKEIEVLLRKRDDLDMNRQVSPLKKASDALLIDTSDLCVEDVVNLMYEKIKRSF